jgi:hypothetical protein
MYEYEAEIVRWVDGDTVDLRVSLGFGITRADRFRLYGIDTPERGQPGHGEATAFCMGAAPVGSLVTIRRSAHSNPTFGRTSTGAGSPRSPRSRPRRP